MSLPALYTPEEAATQLKVSRRAVYQWLKAGRIRGLRVGQHWRISEDQLINFMQHGNRDTFTYSSLAEKPRGSGSG